jgi:hypothetical protein
VSEEQEHWRRVISELRGPKDCPRMTVAAIAEAVGVEPRQVWRWMDGDRPLGLNAVKLHELHAGIKA